MEGCDVLKETHLRGPGLGAFQAFQLQKTLSNSSGQVGEELHVTGQALAIGICDVDLMLLEELLQQRQGVLDLSRNGRERLGQKAKSQSFPA